MRVAGGRNREDWGELVGPVELVKLEEVVVTGCWRLRRGIEELGGDC